FLNFAGPNGINLILDTSGSVPYAEYVCFDRMGSSECASNASYGPVPYSTLKAMNFDNTHRDKIFHYVIWGTKRPGDDIPSNSDHADDILITFDDWGSGLPGTPAFNQSVRSKVEEFVHELGHDLGLQHGGGVDTDHCYVANHWSVMSYSWDTRTG